MDWPKAESDSNKNQTIEMRVKTVIALQAFRILDQNVTGKLKQNLKKTELHYTELYSCSDYKL